MPKVLERNLRAELAAAFKYCRSQKGHDWVVDFFGRESMSLAHLERLVDAASPSRELPENSCGVIQVESAEAAMDVVLKWQQDCGARLGNSARQQLALLVGQLVM